MMLTPNKVSAYIALSACLNFIQYRNNYNTHYRNKMIYNNIKDDESAFNKAIKKFNETQNAFDLYYDIYYDIMI